MEQEKFDLIPNKMFSKKKRNNEEDSNKQPAIQAYQFTKADEFKKEYEDNNKKETQVKKTKNKKKFVDVIQVKGKLVPPKQFYKKFVKNPLKKKKGYNETEIFTNSADYMFKKEREDEHDKRSRWAKTEEIHGRRDADMRDVTGKTLIDSRTEEIVYGVNELEYVHKNVARLVEKSMEHSEGLDFVNLFPKEYIEYRVSLLEKLINDIENNKDPNVIYVIKNKFDINRLSYDYKDEDTYYTIKEDKFFSRDTFDTISGAEKQYDPLDIMQYATRPTIDNVGNQEEIGVYQRKINKKEGKKKSYKYKKENQTNNDTITEANNENEEAGLEKDYSENQVVKEEVKEGKLENDNSEMSGSEQENQVKEKKLEQLVGLKVEHGLLKTFKVYGDKKAKIQKVKEDYENKITIIDKDNYKTQVDYDPETLLQLFQSGNVVYYISNFHNTQKVLDNMLKSSVNETFDLTKYTNYRYALTGMIKKLKEKGEANKIMTSIIKQAKRNIHLREQYYNDNSFLEKAKPRKITEGMVTGLLPLKKNTEFGTFIELAVLDINTIEAARNLKNSWMIGNIDSEFMAFANKYPSIGKEAKLDMQNAVDKNSCDSGTPESIIARLVKINDVRDKMFDMISNDTRLNVIDDLTDFIEVNGIYMDKYEILRMVMRHHPNIAKIFKTDVQHEFNVKDAEEQWGPMPAYNTRMNLFGMVSSDFLGGKPNKNYRINALVSQKLVDFYEDLFIFKKDAKNSQIIPRTPIEFASHRLGGDFGVTRPASYNSVSRGLPFGEKFLKRDVTIPAEIDRALQIIKLIDSYTEGIKFDWKSKIEIKGYKDTIFNFYKENSRTIKVIIEKVLSLYEPDFRHAAMKTKFETHDVEKAARLFFPSNTTGNIIPQFVYNMFVAMVGKREGSLYGTSTSGSHMSALVTSLLKESEKQKIIQYCDNIYLTGERQYFSIDISSMEANHTTESMFFLSLLGGLFVLRHKEMSTWAIYTYIDNVVCTIKKCFFAITENNMGVVPFNIMLSGRAGTSFYNDYFTKFLVYRAQMEKIRFVENKELSKSFKEFMISFGLNWKIEKHIDVDKIEEGRLDVDMLGNSVIVYDKKEINAVVVLERSRVIKSLCFDQVISKSDIVHVVVSYLKVKNLLQTGMIFDKDIGTCALDYLLHLSGIIKNVLNGDGAEVHIKEIEEYGITQDLVNAEIEKPIVTTWDSYINEHAPAEYIRQIMIKIKNKESPLSGVTFDNQGLQILQAFVNEKITKFKNNENLEKLVEERFERLKAYERSQKQFIERNKASVLNKRIIDLINEDGEIYFQLPGNDDLNGLIERSRMQYHDVYKVGNIVDKNIDKRPDKIIDSVINFYLKSILSIKGMVKSDEFPSDLVSKVLSAVKPELTSYLNLLYSDSKNIIKISGKTKKLQAMDIDNIKIKALNREFSIEVPNRKFWKVILEEKKRTRPEQFKNIINSLKKLCSAIVCNIFDVFENRFFKIDGIDEKNDEVTDKINILYTYYIMVHNELDSEDASFNFPEFLQQLTKKTPLKTVKVVVKKYQIESSGDLAERYKKVFKESGFIEDPEIDTPFIIVNRGIDKLNERLSSKTKVTNVNQILAIILTGTSPRYNKFTEKNSYKANLINYSLYKGDRIIQAISMLCVLYIWKDDEKFNEAYEILELMYKSNPLAYKRNVLLPLFKNKKAIYNITPIYEKEKEREKGIQLAACSTLLIMKNENKAAQILYKDSFKKTSLNNCAMCTALMILGLSQEKVDKECGLHKYIPIKEGRFNIELKNRYQEPKEFFIRFCISQFSDGKTKFSDGECETFNINNEDAVFELDLDKMCFRFVSPNQKEEMKRTIVLPYIPENIKIAENNLGQEIYFQLNTDKYVPYNEMISSNTGLSIKDIVTSLIKNIETDIQSVFSQLTIGEYVMGHRVTISEMMSDVESECELNEYVAFYNSEFITTKDEHVNIYNQLTMNPCDNLFYFYFDKENIFKKLLKIKHNVIGYNKNLEKKDIKFKPLWLEAFIHSTKDLPKRKTTLKSEMEMMFFDYIDQHLKQRGFIQLSEPNGKSILLSSHKIIVPNMSNGDKLSIQQVVTNTDLTYRMENIPIDKVVEKGLDLELTRAVFKYIYDNDLVEEEDLLTKQQCLKFKHKQRKLDVENMLQSRVHLCKMLNEVNKREGKKNYDKEIEEMQESIKNTYNNNQNINIYNKSRDQVFENDLKETKRKR